MKGYIQQNVYLHNNFSEYWEMLSRYKLIECTHE